MDSEEDSEDDEDSSDEEEDENDEEDLEDEDEDGQDHLGDSTTELRDVSDSENELDLDGAMLSALKRKKTQKRGRKGGHPVLDDGFFDLAEFNAETEQAEAKRSSKGRLGKGDDDDEEDEGEEEGIDYFAPVEDDAEVEEDGGRLFSLSPSS